ncbi:MAG: glycosyltransferase family 39 protein [Myxococcota bacterium]|nr:glycosyltransferase family 39 protein [Myxococcota bacterium]
MPEADSSTAARRAWLIRAGVALALVAFAVPLCRRSIVLADEGYILMQSWDLLNGKILYREMDAFVTPGIWLLLAGTFKLLGPSVIASRVPALIALIALYGTGYRITSRLAGPGYAALALVGLLVGTVWAFPGWTFAFYSPFSVLFALLALDRLLAWRDTERVRDLAWCGALVGLSIVFKQNYGVLALAGLAAGAMAIRAEQGLSGGAWLRSVATDARWLAAGTAAAGLPFVAYLGVEGALSAAWQSLVLHPFEFSGRHDIPYLSLGALARADFLKDGGEMLTYAAQPIYRVPPMSGWLYQTGIVERMHVLYYWAPPVVLLIGAALSYRPDRERVIDAGLFSLVAVAGGVFLGVFPRADFNHLANVYQPIVLAGVVVTHRLLLPREGTRSPMAKLLAGFALLGAAAYAVVAAYWYVALIEHLDTKVTTPRAGVLARPEQAERIDYQVRTIQAETAPGEALLTVPDLSMLNFLTDRPLPSAFYNQYEHHIAHDQGAAVVQGSERSGVRLAVTRFNDFFSDRIGLREYAPTLSAYLRTHFEMKYTMGREDFIHLVRRSRPIALPEETSILPFCDISPGYQEIREHLLFPALYHDPGTGGEMEAATIETLCQIAVPREGADLSIRVAYRAPSTVAPGTTLTAEILVIGHNHKTLIARKQFAVEPEGIDVRRRVFAQELRADLSDWAGSPVRLLLRTTRRGRVHVRPFERQGFGTVWEDPKLVPPARKDDS